MADIEPAATMTMERRGKLYVSARVPTCLEITYPPFSSMGRSFGPTQLIVKATPNKGEKLYLQFSEANIDYSAHACPHPHTCSTTETYNIGGHSKYTCCAQRRLHVQSMRDVGGAALLLQRASLAKCDRLSSHVIHSSTARSRTS